MMKWRSTGMLLLVVVATGAAIWVLERDLPGTRERSEQAHRALRVAPNEIEFLAVTTSNQAWACRRDGVHWRFTEPITGFADIGEINRLLTGLKNLPLREVITPEQRKARGLGLHEYGLELPVATLRLASSGAPERTILVGGASPVGDSVYVMEPREGNVVATGPEILDLLPAKLTAIRSRQLMPNAPFVLRRIEIKRPNGFILLVNEEDRGWFLQQPVVSRADQSFIRDLILKLTSAEISGFVEDHVSDFVSFGLDPPEAKASLWPLGGGPVRSISLGRPSPSHPDRVYARTDDGTSVVEVSSQLLADVSLDANAFRDRRLMDVASERVATIRLAAGDRAVEMRHDDAGAWFLTRPRSRAADSTRVWDALDQWTEIRIEQFVSDTVTNRSEWALGEPVRELVLSAHDPDAEDGGDPGEDVPGTAVEGIHHATFRFYPVPDEPGSLYVIPEESGSLYKVPADPFLSFPVDPLQLYDRTVLQLVPGDVRRIQVVRGGSAESVERDGEGTWTAGSDDPGRPRPGVIEAIIAEVSNLRAVRYVAEDPELLETYGLAEPNASMTLKLTGEAGISKTVLFGSSAPPDGVFAMIRGQATVFVLPGPVRDRLLGRLLEAPADPARKDEGVMPTPPGTGL